VTFADVLLRVVPNSPMELERLSVAVDLTRRLQGKLNGFFISKEDDSKSGWAQALFERSVARSPLETSWRVVDGHSDAGLLFLARRSDLVILPCCNSDQTRPSRGPEQVALRSGRPVLILPLSDPPISIGGTVVVGWTESPEAARAIHEAMPFLVAADRVLVLTVFGPDEGEPMADMRLLEHLRQHGVAAELVRRHGEDAAEEIASEVRRVDADMLVIGLHEEFDPIEPRLGDVSHRFVHTGSLAVFCSC
jgi:nucleotide-binding universal stress UspA family protein